MNKFDILRKKYKHFIYNDYYIYEKENTYIIEYNFEIPNLTKFNPIIKINKKDIEFNSIDDYNIQNIVFNLGMIELISYWKCTCSKEIIIKCGNLDKEQINWFKKLYYNGLGEFRYINNINVNKEDMLEIKVQNEKVVNEKIEKKSNKTKGILIPIGGGKDSIVTLELLKNFKSDSLCFTVGSKFPSIESVKIAGYDVNKMIEIERKIDKNLIDLNNRGFLNGHTPFSALLAFLSYLIANLTNKKYIALSNESSANESNIIEENINHQYSKSFEFEQDIRWYFEKYLKYNVEYFSFLRPINELQIAKIFSDYKKYHKIFRSCNEGSKSKKWEWCNKCPKCLFVYIILSPFLYKQDLIEIFGTDLFEDKELLKIFINLTGNGNLKPFECVGTFEEIQFAITKTINEIENKNEKLPYLLEYYKNNFELSKLKDNYLLKQYNENNNLPKEFNNILKGKILND